MPKTSRRQPKSARRSATSRSAASRSGARPSRARTKARPARAAKRARASSGNGRPTVRPRSSDKGAAMDRALRDLLIKQLEGGHAYTTFAEAIRDLPAELRGVRPEGVAHSPWQVLEHMRISQWDIVDFTRDPGHRSPAWPSGYWPQDPEPPNEAAWDVSVREFERELAAMQQLIADPNNDLFAQIDHPEARSHHTIAR